MVASNESFPKPYVNEVPKNGDRKLMEYVEFPTMGIGARRSGLPNSPTEGPTLTHVGQDATRGGGKRGR